MNTIIIPSILLAFCIPRGYTSIDSNSAKLMIITNTCINFEKPQNFIIRLKNTSNTNYFVNQWHLYSILLCDMEGNMVPRKNSMHQWIPDVPEFVLLNAGDSISVNLEKNISEFYKIGKEKTYKLKSIYQNSIKKKKTKEKMLLGWLESPCITIGRCE